MWYKIDIVFFKKNFVKIQIIFYKNLKNFTNSNNKKIILIIKNNINKKIEK